MIVISVSTCGLMKEPYLNSHDKAILTRTFLHSIPAVLFDKGYS